jgi:hypothetical protein
VEKKYLVILGAAFASILFISFIYLEKDADQEVRTPLVMTQIPLWCFEKNTDYLWESTVTIGCINEAQSLGATRIPIPTGEVFELNPLVKTRFLAAEAQAKLEGFKIEITSGFRSKARQLFLFNQAIKKYKTTEEASKWVLPPSISHHPKGIALDVNYPTGPTGAKWLEINGYKFGLCRVYENEWWHFEPLVAPGELCPELIINALAAIN